MGTDCHRYDAGREIDESSEVSGSHGLHPCRAGGCPSPTTSRRASLPIRDECRRWAWDWPHLAERILSTESRVRQSGVVSSAKGQQLFEAAGLTGSSTIVAHSPWAVHQYNRRATAPRIRCRSDVSGTGAVELFDFPLLRHFTARIALSTDEAGIDSIARTASAS